jgi:hypothetical protein
MYLLLIKSMYVSISNVICDEQQQQQQNMHLSGSIRQGSAMPFLPHPARVGSGT